MIQAYAPIQTSQHELIARLSTITNLLISDNLMTNYLNIGIILI